MQQPDNHHDGKDVYGDDCDVSYHAHFTSLFFSAAADSVNIRAHVIAWAFVHSWTTIFFPSNTAQNFPCRIAVYFMPSFYFLQSRAKLCSSFVAIEASRGIIDEVRNLSENPGHHQISPNVFSTFHFADCAFVDPETISHLALSPAPIYPVSFQPICH
jgi:hypothetical protein